MLCSSKQATLFDMIQACLDIRQLLTMHDSYVLSERKWIWGQSKRVLGSSSERHVSGDVFGAELSAPKKICWKYNHQSVSRWPCLVTGSLQRPSSLKGSWGQALTQCGLLSYKMGATEHSSRQRGESHLQAKERGGQQAFPPSLQ